MLFGWNIIWSLEQTERDSYYKTWLFRPVKCSPSNLKKSVISDFTPLALPALIFNIGHFDTILNWLLTKMGIKTAKIKRMGGMFTFYIYSIRMFKVLIESSLNYVRIWPNQFFLNLAYILRIRTRIFTFDLNNIAAI